MGFHEVAQIHHKLMPILWVITVDVLMILATYTSSKVAVTIHSVGGLLMTILTCMYSLPMLSDVIGSLDPVKKFKFYFHVFLGVFCMCAFILQVLSGILTKVLNITGGKSVNILSIKRYHMVLGIILALLLKLQVYVKMPWETQKYLYLILDIILLAFYCFRKFGTSRLAFGSSGYEKAQLPTVNSLKQLINQNNKLVIYGNNIYDLTDMSEWHPAGFEIVESVKNSQVQKYLFGIYGSVKEQNIKSYAHSNNSLQLLSSPIARLAIPSNFKGLAPENVVTVSELRRVSEEASVYELHLKPKTSEFQLTGYKDIKQLGRFYCLTQNKTITRLYTTVNFLNWKNVILLKQYLKKNSSLEKYFEQRNCHSQSVPILFKHYENGQFTNKFINDRQPQLTLSQQQGLGLQLDEIAPGEIVIMAGGTGIFPFLDLIDLIYKRHLADQNPNLLKTLSEDNSLISSEIFSKFTFQIYASFQELAQLHPIVLQQWIQLTSSKRIKIILKTKSATDRSNYPQLKFTEQMFEKLALQLCQESKPISKIFICGPTRMNEALQNILSINAKNQISYTVL